MTIFLIINDMRIILFEFPNGIRKFRKLKQAKRYAEANKFTRFAMYYLHKGEIFKDFFWKD